MASDPVFAVRRRLQPILHFSDVGSRKRHYRGEAPKPLIAAVVLAFRARVTLIVLGIVRPSALRSR
jgi:hypothetical protein